MNKIFIIPIIIAVLIIGGLYTMANNNIQPFEKGEINPYSEFFTGETHLNMLVSKDDVFNSSIGNVTFKKGARTNWHKHSGGQILLLFGSKNIPELAKSLGKAKQEFDNAKKSAEKDDEQQK